MNDIEIMQRNTIRKILFFISLSNNKWKGNLFQAGKRESLLPAGSPAKAASAANTPQEALLDAPFRFPLFPYIPRNPRCLTGGFLLARKGNRLHLPVVRFRPPPLQTLHWSLCLTLRFDSLHIKAEALTLDQGSIFSQKRESNP